MDAFEKWKPVNGYGVSSLDEIAEQAFLAGKAEGIKEGMRRAAEIMRERRVLASDFYHELLLKEIGA